MFLFNPGYVTFLCNTYPEIIEEGIIDSEEFTHDIIKKLKISTQPVKVDIEQAAEFLLGKCNMSQRSYKSLKKILQQENVILPKYEDTVNYCKELNVGNILFGCNECEKCMCSVTSLTETLQHIVSSKLFDLFEFKNEEETHKIYGFLKEKNPDLFKSFDPKKRTIFLRQTGDNFRACAKMPTEQISFSVLNIRSMINNPYGQFINCLWRGSESRDGLQIHVSDHFKALDEVAGKGIELLVNNEIEHFNVVIFLVTDIGLLEKILGKCSSISKFGCFWCDQQKDDWNIPGKSKGKLQSITDMISNGNKAIAELGTNPNHSTAAFKKFQQAHKGQYVCIKGFAYPDLEIYKFEILLAQHFWRNNYEKC